LRATLDVVFVDLLLNQFEITFYVFACIEWGQGLELPDVGFVFSTLGSNQLVIKECPFCPDIKDKPDNMWKLNINTVSGLFNCYRCNSHGSWYGICLFS
jgi:hypothetical protein